MAIDYSQIPLTFAPISATASIVLTNPYNEQKSFKYNKNNTGWQDYTFGDIIQLSYSDENNYDTIAFSGDSTPYYRGTTSDTEKNFFPFNAYTSYVRAYGNIHSLIDYTTITTNCFRNLFRNQQYITDYSKIWLPLPSGYSVSGLFGSAFRQDSYVQKLPIFRMTDFTNLPYQTFNATGYSSKSISCVEVCWTEWPQNWSSNNGMGYYFLYQVRNNSTSIFIKPQSLTLTRGNYKIPNGWTVLNRISGLLYFAEDTTWNGNSYSAGDLFQDEDPYAWYYGDIPQPKYAGVIFQSTGSNTISLNKIGNPQNTTIQYTLDGFEWAEASDSINLNDGDKVAFSGNAKFSKNIQNRYSFATTGNGTLILEGDLSGLTSSATIEDDYQFNSLFSGCSNIVDASKLTLPKNTTKWCYANMFLDCNNLTAAPQLPASGLNRWCYSSMFGNCSSLLQAPFLKATTLAPFSYYCMFYGCENLKDAPQLKASSLTSWCYNSLLYGCSNLSSIYSKNIEWSPSTATSNWVNGVASAGTFSKMTALSTIYGASNIPSGWQIVLIDEEPDYSTIPLTFKSHGNTNIFLKTNGQSAPTKTFYYSKNDGPWTLYINNVGGNYTGTQINLEDGDTIAFSGIPNNLSLQSQSDDSQWMFNNNGNWDSTNYLQAYGNVMSLHNWEDFTTNCCYRSLFRSSTMIYSCFNVIFPNDSNLNRSLGYSSVYRNSRVAINPKMVSFDDTEPMGILDYTWNSDNYLKYVGIDIVNWNGWGGGLPIQNGGVFCKTPRTPLPQAFNTVTVINWHSEDDTYWIVDSNNQETNQRVILNNDGTITYV